MEDIKYKKQTPNKNTGNTYNGLAFYLNGNLVNEPVITSREWNVLGITFLLVYELTTAL